jgi:hypothetical protein
VTGEAAGWWLVAACFTAAGYLLARAVDAMRDDLADWSGQLTSGWWNDGEW